MPDIQSNFNIIISETAERINYDDLSDKEKDTLSRGIQYNPKEHDVFRFFILVQPQINKYKKKRTRQRRSYDLVNTVLVDVNFRHEIKLLGIYPTTTLTSGQTSFDLKGEAIVEFGKNFKLTIKGRAKNIAGKKRNSHLILASRTDSIAQWLFFKPYIENHLDYEVEVLCIVPRTLEKDNLFLVCSTSFKDGGREIESVNRKKVFFYSQ